MVASERVSESKRNIAAQEWLDAKEMVHQEAKTKLK